MAAKAFEWKEKKLVGYAQTLFTAGDVIVLLHNIISHVPILSTVFEDPYDCVAAYLHVYCTL